RKERRIERYGDSVALITVAHRYLEEIIQGKREIDETTIALVIASMYDAWQSSPSWGIRWRLRDAYFAVLGLRSVSMRREATGADGQELSKIDVVNHAFPQAESALRLATSRLLELLNP